MPGPTQLYTTATLLNTVVVTTTELVVCQIAGIEVPRADAIVAMDGNLTLTCGTSTTAVRARVRRGADITGTVVADSGAVTAGVAGAALIQVEAMGQDPVGAVAQASYVLTVQQTAAGANGTVNFGALQLFIYN